MVFVRNNITVMVNEMVKDLKENGISNILETTKNLSKNLGDKVDPESMKETCGLMTDLINNSDERLQGLIDSSDPQTAESMRQNASLLKQFSGPMKLLKSFLPQQPK